jgi:hypothetical protein
LSLVDIPVARAGSGRRALHPLAGVERPPLEVPIGSFAPKPNREGVAAAITEASRRHVLI